MGVDDTVISGSEDYISIAELEGDDRIFYDLRESVLPAKHRRYAGREPWARNVLVSPSNVEFSVVDHTYEVDNASSMDFHFFPNTRLNAVKGPIRNAMPLKSYHIEEAVWVYDQNIVIHMNPYKDKEPLTLEVEVRRID